MIDFPITDAHTHLWDPSVLRYPWLDGMPLLNRAYLPADFLENAASAGANVTRLIFIQAECLPAQGLAEAEWVAALSADCPVIAGIVAYAPLEKGEAARADLAALSRIPSVKGVRRIIQYEEDIGFCLRPDFIRGVRMLPEYGFTFDLCVSHPLMPNLIRFAEQCPEVSFILDHIGKPDIKAHIAEPWKSDLRRLAAFPNVSCKISGLVTEADHDAWTAEDLKPYIRHTVECFGYDRIVFGGDWPVVLLAADYRRWIETLAAALSDASDAQLRALFHDNALAFYKIPAGPCPDRVNTI